MTDFPKFRVSVIIINYNSDDRLHKCIESLEGQVFRDFEIIVLDNASADTSMAQAQDLFPDVTYILNEENIGFAAGNNKAVLRATGEWLAFLNPDAYPDANWLQELIAACNRYPDVKAFGSTQINSHRREIIDGAGDALHVVGVPYRCLFGKNVKRLPAGDVETFSPCAAAAFYEKSVFERLGGFDEDLFCYAEDVDLGFRLRLGGGKAMQVRKAIVYHEGSGITGRYSDFTVYHGNRNRIWVSYTNFPGFYYWLFLPFQLFFNIWFIFRAFTIGTGHTYIRALVDGYARLPELSEKRRRIQTARVATGWSVVKSMTWSPLKMLRREG